MAYIVNHADGIRSFSVIEQEVFGPSTFPVSQNKYCNPRPISAVDLTTNSIKIAGDFTYRFVSGLALDILNSGMNDGGYTVSSSTYNGTVTTIVLVEPLNSNSTPYGNIFYVVPSSEIYTTLTMVGKKYLNFGDYVNENFLHLLENFASANPPPNPTVGQMWYDTSVSGMKVYDGTSFQSITSSGGSLDLATADARYVKLSGSTMTGALTLSGAPTNNLHATTKVYTDDLAKEKYLCGFFAGPYDANELLLQMVMPKTLTIPAGASNSRLRGGAAATSSVTFSLRKNGVQFGTVVVNAAASTGSFNVSSSTSFAAGDLLQLVAPASVDATFENISLTVALQQ